MADQAPAAGGIPLVASNDDEKLKAAIAYVLSWLGGIIVLVIGGDNKFLKFHAWQSIIFGVIVTILAIIGSFFCIGIIIFPLGWLYMLYGAYMVYTGKPFNMPMIGDFVKSNFMK